ncbi:MAG: hypothetical protein AAF569_04695 [Pseudomonadota bacterium]
MQDIAQFLKDTWQVAAPYANLGLGLTGNLLTVVGGVTVITGGWRYLVDRRSGLHQVTSNSDDNVDFAQGLKAVEDAFAEKPNINCIIVEFADYAVVQLRGKEPIVLDFTKDKDEMHDAVIYTQIKSMIGKKSPEEIYQFAAVDGWNDADVIVNGGTPEGMDENEAARIREHAWMKCSDFRKMLFKPRGRRRALENHKAILSVLGGDSDGMKQKTNVSRRGSLGLAYNSVMEGAPPDTIVIKPHTDTEKKIRTQICGTRRANVDEHGKPVSGDQGAGHYSRIRDVQTAHDIEKIERRKRLWSFGRHAA